MGLVETDDASYMIQPVGDGGLEDNPHIMYNIKDWSYISDKHKHSVDSKCMICVQWFVTWSTECDQICVKKSLLYITITSHVLILLPSITPNNRAML